MYGREFQSMLEGLDEEGCVEEPGHHAEKKRRLSVDQVKALEKNFEVENKLEPDRKVKLAQELGLQPRQVAVWFQNRRARWKTKQLERDYGVLKAKYETLKLSFDTLQQDNEALLKEIKELKSRVEGENTESDGSVKEEMVTVAFCETPIPGSETKELSYECLNKSEGSVLKDGSSESDSSAILNDENNNSSCGVLQSESLMNCFQFQKQYVKMEDEDEEQNFLSADEACNFFADEQAPTLQWYCSEEWS